MLKKRGCQVRTAIGRMKATVHIGVRRFLRVAARGNVQQFYRAEGFLNHRAEHRGRRFFFLRADVRFRRQFELVISLKGQVNFIKMRF